MFQPKVYLYQNCCIKPPERKISCFGTLRWLAFCI